MAGTRRYKLLCPIARALDRIGDRWTLLILRDLHAGPARFSDLQTGLSGIAPNLLTDRLQNLTHDGLVERVEGPFGAALYTLTDLGRRTREVLFELALFGGRFRPDENLKRPGNLRTIAIPLGQACQRVVTADMDFVAELNIDGELFALTAGSGSVDLTYAPAHKPDVTMTTSYEPFIAAAEGEMAIDDFVRNHVQIRTGAPAKAGQLMELLGAAMKIFAT